MTLGACSGAEPVRTTYTQDRIQPYTEKPAYWQYRGEPVLLLGGSPEDNLFQHPEVEAVLNTLVAAGGNYVRNTMSSRDEGNVWAFKQDEATGQYDLTQPNPEYWARLERLLEAAYTRDVIVQVEVWATFDFYDGDGYRYPRNWSANPFNPKNNIQYTTASSGLPDTVASHPTATENPFFWSVPTAENNTAILPHQERFVRWLLERTLGYPNVLYAMDNETSVTPAWGAYWADFIRAEADKQGRAVETTEMWDPWDLAHPMHSNTFDDPARYTFVDVSQNNHQVGEAHWRNAQQQRQRLVEAGTVRPMTNVKVYGGHYRFGTPSDGVARVVRNVFGGMASTRFHRPEAGLGLSDTAQVVLSGLRTVTDELNVWDAEDCTDEALDASRTADEAYCMRTATHMAVYLPAAGEVVYPAERPFTFQTLDLMEGVWSETSRRTPQDGRFAFDAVAGNGTIHLIRFD